MSLNMFKRRLALMVALLLATHPGVLAQNIAGVTPLSSGAVSITVTDAGTCSASSTACAVLNTGGYTAVSIQVSGTWVGTLQFEMSVDGTNWVSVNMTPPSSTTAVTSTTANGVWTGTSFGLRTRVRASTLSSGTAVATVRATLTAKLGGGGAPTGSAGGDLSGSYPSPTVAKVDGVTYPASPSTNTVPVVTGSNQITYEAVPPAAGGTGASTTATSGRYLKGGGTNWGTSSGSASGVGACAANSWASTLNSDAAPTCTQPASSNLSDASNVMKLDAGQTVTSAIWNAGAVTTTGPFTLNAPAATDGKVKIKAATSGGYAAATEYWQDNAQKWQTGVGIQGGATFVLQGVTNSITALQVSELGAITITDPPTAGAGADYLCMSTGKVINQGVTCAASAERFKTNIVVLDHGLDYLEKFQPSAFDWVYNKSAAIGLIADQVAKIDPRLAVYQKEDIEWTEWEEGEIARAVRIGDFVSTPAIRGWVEVPKRMRSDKETIFSTNDKAIIAVLVKSVQEQQAQIKVLQEKLGIQ